MAQQPGDSKNTVDKLTETASSVGTNIKETGEHYANKSEVQGSAQKVSDATTQAVGNTLNTAESVGKNAKETVEHEANKANNSTGVGEKTYLEQAQDLAAGALNTASKAAADLANTISNAAAGEKK